MGCDAVLSVTCVWVTGLAVKAPPLVVKFEHVSLIPDQIPSFVAPASSSLQTIPLQPALRFNVTSPSSRWPPFGELTRFRCNLSSSDNAVLVGTTVANLSSGGSVEFTSFGVIAPEGAVVQFVVSCPWINGDVITSQDSPVNVSIQKWPFSARYTTVTVLSSSQNRVNTSVLSSALAVATVQCDTVLYQIRLALKLHAHPGVGLDAFNVTFVSPGGAVAVVAGPVSRNVTITCSQHEMEAFLAGTVSMVMATAKQPDGVLFGRVIFPEFGGYGMLGPTEALLASPERQPSCQVMFGSVSSFDVQVTTSCDMVLPNITGSLTLGLTGESASGAGRFLAFTRESLSCHQMASSCAEMFQA
jgi:hypothetical protein